MKKSYKEILVYPLLVWIAFEIVSFVLGFTAYVNATTQMLLGNGSMLLAILFGVWIGSRSSKAFNYLWVSMISAVMLIVIVGFVNLLLNFALITYSQTFINYMSQYGPSGSLVDLVLNASITTWFELAMLTIVGSALAYEFSSK